MVRISTTTIAMMGFLDTSNIVQFLVTEDCTEHLNTWVAKTNYNLRMIRSGGDSCQPDDFVRKRRGLMVAITKFLYNETLNE